MCRDVFLRLQDHINFTLGKQSALLNHGNDAISSFNALFSPNNRIQNAQQQINFFKEYLTVFNVSLSIALFLSLQPIVLAIELIPNISARTARASDRE